MLSSLVASFQPLVQTSFQVTAIFPFMATARSGMVPTGMGLITGMVRMGMVPTAMDGITAIVAITACARGSTRDCSKYRLDCRSVALSVHPMCPQACSQGFKDSKVISTLLRERAGAIAADLEAGLTDVDIAVKDEPRTRDSEIGQARIEEEISICQL